MKVLFFVQKIFKLKILVVFSFQAISGFLYTMQWGLLHKRVVYWQAFILFICFGEIKGFVIM